MVARGPLGCRAKGGLMGQSDTLMSLLPFLIGSVPLAWGNYLLAKKSGRTGAVFVVLTMVPLVGYVTTIYLFYSCVIRLLDRQNGFDAVAAPSLMRGSPSRSPA
jgi:hypothetical protein